MQQELESQKVFLQGCDEYGRAVVVVLANRHYTRSRNFEETLRFIVYTLDAAVLASDLSKNPDAHLLVLFDLSGKLMCPRHAAACCTALQRHAVNVCVVRLR